MDVRDDPITKDIFVGRQPIYDRHLQLYAYELLYRGGDVDFASFSEGDRATSQVLLNTFTEFGVDRVVGNHLAFINLTRGFIVGEYPLPVPRTQVVLEVLEDVLPDDDVIEGLKSLRRKGFRIALDDFVYGKGYEPMLAIADIVKVDVQGLDANQIHERYETLKPYGAKLLAEKIETRTIFEVCLEIGFDYFQGYFLARPNVVAGTSVPPSRISLLRLLAELQDPACDFEKVKQIVSQDVTLSYKLLRQVDRSAHGVPHGVESIKEIVAYLGLSAVKNMACLFLLAEMRDTPRELIATSMLRAKMCELLGAARGVEDLQPYFTAGLFSILDAMMDTNMENILSRLPLSKDLESALLEGSGPVGEALACTLAYERGDWEHVVCPGLGRAEIKAAFLDAVAWVDHSSEELATQEAA